MVAPVGASADAAAVAAAYRVLKNYFPLAPNLDSAYAASLASIDCVKQIVHEESIACDFSCCGHLEVACKQAHFDDYARQVEVIGREFHHELKIVSREETRRKTLW